MSMVLILLLALCVLFSAFFSSSETSLFSLSAHDTFSLKRSKALGDQKVARLLARPSDLLITILILNILVNVGIQNVSAQIFSSFESWVFTILVPLLITLLLGEVLPKSFAYSKNKFVARFAGPVIYQIFAWMQPITRRVSALTFSMSRVMFFFLKDPKPVDRHELLHVLKKSLSHGVIKGNEIELIEGFLQLQEVNVKEAMTPRDEIIYFSIGSPLEELYTLIIEKQCSKIPVCEGSLDDILGIVTVEELFKHYGSIKTSDDLKSILRRPFYVPEHLSAYALFQEPKMQSEDVALVVDEYGFVEGIVTHEDIVEVIVGNIVDQRDQKSLYTKVGNHVIIASGKLEIVEFEKLFHTQIDHSNDTASIGGFVTEHLGRIPEAGDEVTIDGIIYHVLSADPTKVRSLYIRSEKTEELK